MKGRRVMTEEEWAKVVERGADAMRHPPATMKPYGTARHVLDALHVRELIEAAEVMEKNITGWTHFCAVLAKVRAGT